MTTRVRTDIDFGLWYWNSPPDNLIDKVCWTTCGPKGSPMNLEPWEWDKFPGQVFWRCKECKKPPFSIIRKCSNPECERIFLRNFLHPAFCMVHPLCWLCCEERRENNTNPCLEYHSMWYGKILDRMAETPIVPPKVIPLKDYDWENDVIEDLVL